MNDTQRHNTIKSLIEGTKGKISVAWFIKQDGTPRKMVFRTKVKKGVKGVGRNFDPDEKGLVGVYDMEHAVNKEDPEEKSFRFINSKTTFALQVAGEIIKIGATPEGFEFD